MAIKDLKIREGKVDIVVEVVDKGDVREFEKFGKPGRVCNAKVKDDSGEITLSLSNDDIDKIKAGDKLHIKNGYVGEWQGEPQLGAGKFGEIEIVEGSEATSDEASEATTEEGTKTEKTEEEVLDIKEEKIE